MLNNEQFRDEVIRPALDSIGHYSEEAEELLVLTMAYESDGGTYLKQIEGPAVGIYQIEPGTYNDMWTHYLPYKQGETYKMLNSLQVSSQPPLDHVKYNIFYATQIARMFYLRVPESLPAHNDAKALAGYYKTYWNTSAGKAKIEDVIAKYNLFIGKKVRHEKIKKV